MLQSTQGIVLRPVKYGETSLVCTIFTRLYGVQAYLVQGIRTAAGKGKGSRAGLLQPASLLDMVVYHKPGGVQRMKEFAPAHLYTTLQESVIKNSVALFSAELLLRLLPEAAPAPELFDFCLDYFKQTDVLPDGALANFPLFFLVQCSRYLGYEITGAYTAETPYLNLQEGGFTRDPPLVSPPVTEDDARALASLFRARSLAEVPHTELNGAARQRLMEWYLQFLRRHTEHMGVIRSLAVLQAVLR